MADQQRRVSLVFEANANQAKQEINGLMQSLQKLQSMPATTIDSRGIREANKAAMELQGHLQKAINVDTGKLDLSRFTASLTNSGKTLQQYANTLTRIGPAGDTAFKSLISQINKSETSTLRLTKGMRDFITTMKNTVKWQISSNIMHGFMGAIQTAMGYAQELDASLNNIRIVTGQTTEEMAKFATQANKAAQALSTTTTKYTDAALIFYQQGLSDQVVKERTEAVIKMANVTGEAAKDVSSYMTAIWNNFSDGSKSIEYYADVITKLGAATAASSEEIAGGLEKFAAIANTIGLSYEYATSMITTIVDKTRQSEDVVGTALKTILARIQGLSLGDTLEDGTDLNKYSKALASVGISIKTTSGELKGMDQILDDLGSKWGTFSKDTQIALAQVVGGVRQYNQILALMDNWTSFEQNVKLAETSSGSLDEQADIYAESWEASSRRVKNAAQGIYDALIDEKAFTQLNNIFSVLLNGVEGLVEGFGGLMPLLGTLGGFIAQKFAKEMPGAMKSMRENFMILTGRADKQAINQQVQANEITRARMVDTAVSNPALSAEYETLLRIGKMKENLLRNQHQMTTEQIKSYELAIQNEEVAGEQYQARAKELAILEEQTAELKEQAAVEAAHRQAKNDEHNLNTNTNWKNKKTEAKKQLEDQTKALQEEWGKSDTSAKRKKEIQAELAGKGVQISSPQKGQTKVVYNDQYIRTLAQDLYETEAKDRLGKVQDTHNKLAQTKAINQEAKTLMTEFATDPGANLDTFKNKMTQAMSAFEAAGVNVDELKQKFDILNNSSEITEQQLGDLGAALDEVEKSVGETARESRKSATEYGISSEAVNAAAKQGAAQGEHTYKGARADRDIPEIPQKTVSAAEALTASFGTLFSVYASVVAISTAWNTILDENATGMEKAGAIIGALVSVMGSFNSVASLAKTLQITSIPITYAKAKADIIATGASAGLATSIRAVGASIMAIPGIGWILGIIGAIITAIGLFKLFNGGMTKSEKIIQKLTERSEALNAAQEKLESHINDVQSAWEKYQDVVDILNDCTVGTQEWSSALLNCNQSALELLKIAPELSQYMRYNANGSIYISEAGIELYNQRKEHEKAALNAASIITANQIAQTKIEEKYSIKQKEFNAANQAFAEIDSADGVQIEEISKIIDKLDYSIANKIIDATDIYSEKYNSDGIQDGELAYRRFVNYMSEWNKNLELWNSYDQSNQGVYTALFSAMSNFNTENSKLYGEQFTQEATALQKDIYLKKTKEALIEAMISSYGGEQSDYESLSEESLSYSLAIKDVSTNLELMSEIVGRVNSFMVDLTDVGKTLLSNKNLSDAALRDLNTISIDQHAIRGNQLYDLETLTNISEQAYTFSPSELSALKDVGEDERKDYRAGVVQEVFDAIDQTKLPLLGADAAEPTLQILGEAIDNGENIADNNEYLATIINALKEETKGKITKDKILDAAEFYYNNSGLRTASIGEDNGLDIDNGFDLNDDGKNKLQPGIDAYAQNDSDIIVFDEVKTKDFAEDSQTHNKILTDYFGVNEWNTAQNETTTYEEALAYAHQVKNQGQEKIMKKVLGLEENDDLFAKMGITGDSYIEKWNQAVEYVKTNHAEGLARASLLNQMGVDNNQYLLDTNDEEASKEAMKEFATKFGLYTEDMANNISWEIIADRFNELIVENAETALNTWNNGKSERFKTSNLQVDKESGEFIPIAEGASTAMDELVLSLRNDLGMSVKDISNYLQGINALSEGLTIENVQSATAQLEGLISKTGDAGKSVELFNRVLEMTQAKGEKLSQEDLALIAEESGVSIESLSECLNGLAEISFAAIDSITSLTRSFDTLQGTLEALQGLIGITTGSEIKKDDYEKMRDAIPEEYRDLFMRTANGYTFYGTEEQGKEIERLSREGVWNDYTDRYEKVQEAGAGVDGLGKATSGDIDTAWIQTQMADDAFVTFLESTKMLGAGRLEALQNLTQEQWSDQEALNQPEIKEGLDQAIAATIRYLSNGFSHLTDEEAQMQLTGIRSTDELQMAVAEGRIKVGEGEGEIAAAQLQAYGRSLWSGELEEIDIDFKEVEELAKHLKELPEYAKASEDSLLRIAKAQLRWNRSVKAGEKGLEDWKKQLKTVSKGSLGDFADSIEDVQDAYGDILDIDAKKLSTAFLTNTKAMELYEKAIQGSAEAYNELQALAAQDIYSKSIGNVADEIAATIQAIADLDSVDVGEKVYIGDQGIGDQLNILYENAYVAAINGGKKVAEAMGIANNIINSVGYEAPEIEWESKDVTIVGDLPDGWIPLRNGHIQGPDGNIMEGVEWQKTESGQYSYTQTIMVPKGKSFTKTAETFGKTSTPRGGRGGSRAPRAETKKDTDKERYHTVNNQLEDLTDSYDKVSKAADRAFGGAKVKLIRDQIKAVQDLSATQGKYLKEIEDYYKFDKDNLSQVSAYVGFDVQLDENGTITNFDAIQDAMFSAYNKNINEKGEVIGIDEEAWKAYEQEWERIMALIEQYEETQDLRKEALQQLQDYINEIYDLQLQEISYSVEIDIDVSDYGLEILDYMLKRVEDDAWKAVEAIATLGEQTAEWAKQNETYSKGIRDILMERTKDIYDSNGNKLQDAQLTEADVNAFLNGEDKALEKVKTLNLTDEEVQTLKEYMSNLLKINTTLTELRENVFATVLESFQSFAEELDDTIDKMKVLNEMTNTYRNIIDIVGKKNLGISNGLYASLGQANVEQQMDQVASSRYKAESMRANLDAAKAKLAEYESAGMTAEAELMRKNIKEMEKDTLEAEQNFLSTWENALSAAREQFELEMGIVIDTMSDSLAGPLYTSLQQLQEAFDRNNTNAKLHLADYEKIYELNKLNRDIEKSMDETASIQGKQALADLQAEINALEEEGVQISQYQSEDLRRRYELRLAEIALMEAQNAKSEVRMTRDSDGNWNYVYTADSEKVAEAEQNYEDRLFALQQSNAEYIEELQSKLIQAQIEMGEKIAEIRADQTLSVEEQNALIDEVMAHYNEQFNFYTSELELVLGNNRELYETDWKNYSDLTGYKISADENYLDKFTETQLSILTGFKSFDEYKSNYLTSTDTMMKSMSTALDNYIANSKGIFEAAGTAYTNFADLVGKNVTTITEHSERLRKDTEEKAAQTQVEFEKILESVEEWTAKYSALIDDTISKNLDLVNSYKELLEMLGEVKEESPEGESPVASEENTPKEEPEPQPSEPEEPKKAPSIRSGGRVKASSSAKIYDYAGAQGESQYFSSDPKYKVLQIQGDWVQVRHHSLSSGVSGWFKRGDLTAYDTGGYTGAWGPDGRLAMLHEKEIILNKDDSKNFLSAINMVRQVAEIIDLNAYASAGFGNRIAAYGVPNSTGTLEQQVHITAEFPNATDKNEIYEAFNEILNLATQYAGRK